MRQPPTGNRSPASCENCEVSGAKIRDAGCAHQYDETPPARRPRKARLPYGRTSSDTSSGLPASDRRYTTTIEIMPRAIAAALTPLTEGGAALDLDSVAPYVAFLADAGIDGLLVAGTTGEGMNLTLPERKALLEAFASGPLPVIAHCGAQT